MRLTLFAATGGIGRHILAQATAAGHQVTAVVRDPGKLPAGVRAVQADLSAPDPQALADAVAGADAVLSGLGPRRRADSGVTAPGTRAVIAAMQATGVRRIVVVSAAPVGTVASPGNPNPPRHDPGDGFFIRYVGGPLIKAILREHYADLALMEDALRASGLDWTSFRPPRLTDKPLTGRYHTALGRNAPGALASRADVAHAMLAALSQPETIGQTVGIAN
ncbi:NAD(P)-dependent oxidoreductase [Catellatospora tritici]|uniref:NAD(P)-dependent oxidoreductase n=1 Tax=Catellatospora tritici TaxID=2851566 RepID=UPI001C2D02A9|nr:NAD(P)H-binding protein [Catellatospora tritici]MBV1854838.1 NAD(P)H-binding protein [Catellatospora tritici]